MLVQEYKRHELKTYTMSSKTILISLLNLLLLSKFKKTADALF